jgi:hypothetical protein
MHSSARLFPTKSAYLLDQKILAHPRPLKFYVITEPKYSSAPLFAKFCVPTWLRHSSTPSFPSNSTYLLDQNNLVHSCSLNSAYLHN